MKNGIVIDHNEKLTGGQMKNREKPRTLTPSSGAGVRSTPLFDDGNVKLYNGDCFNVLPTVENNSIDLVITSPPFNVGIDYGKGRNEDKKSNKEYHKFACKTMEEIARLLKAGGRACIEIGGSGRCTRFSCQVDRMLG